MKKDATEIARHLLACIFRLDEKNKRSYSKQDIIALVLGEPVIGLDHSGLDLFGWGNQIRPYFLAKVFDSLKELNFITSIKLKGDKPKTGFKLNRVGYGWLVDKKRPKMGKPYSEELLNYSGTVSYTHLTLPTKA